MDLAKTLCGAPVIAAVRDREQLLAATQTPVRVIFLLSGDLFSLPEMVRLALDAEKLLFVHMDLVEGISRDAAGVRWVARVIRPTGVLSTRAPLLRIASEEGLRTILRIFLVDSSSIDTGIRMVASSAPDLVEVMPGLVTRAIGWLGHHIAPPVIAGGMMEQVKDVEAALKAGALAASTSSAALWTWEGRQHGKDDQYRKP